MPPMAPAKVAASILSADLAHLAEQVKVVEPHADIIHVDSMDAHFVPPLTIGPVVVESLRPVTDRLIHAHLMVERPERLLEDYAKAGTDIVTFHTEAAREPAAVIGEAETVGIRVGMGVNPETEIQAVFPHLDRLDNVIVMTLERTGYA
jgi:ribulose-phosphate 3-epimerase